MAKIFIIAGHGAGDCGAVGNGYNEAERVRALAKRIKELGGNNVLLGDVNRDYYADNGISTLTISKDYQIVELHMDSAVAAARGGHVIIQHGFAPDNYDTALANFIADILPGRANKLVPRNDLANPSRAAAKGYGYRLLECGFISNATDIKIFNSKMDEIAKGILNAFGINTTAPTKPNKPAVKQSENVSIAKNTGANNQRWAIEKKGNYVRLRNKANGMYLDLSGASTKNETNIQTYVGNNTDAQLWKIVRKSHGEADYILFEPKLVSGKYMSVAGNVIGGNVKIYDDLKNGKQKFYLRQESDGYYIIIHTCTLGAVTAS